MDSTTVGVDLAKSRFELALADGESRIRGRGLRLGRISKRGEVVNNAGPARPFQ